MGKKASWECCSKLPANTPSLNEFIIFVAGQNNVVLVGMGLHVIRVTANDDVTGKRGFGTKPVPIIGTKAAAPMELMEAEQPPRLVPVPHQILKNQSEMFQHS